MCGDVRYNTWLHSLLSRWILGGGCLSPAGICRVTFLTCSAVLRHIYWYVNDLEDWSGLLRELLFYRKSPFLFGHVVNFLKQYLTSAGNSRPLKCSRHFVDSPEM